MSWKTKSPPEINLFNCKGQFFRSTNIFSLDFVLFFVFYVDSFGLYAVPFIHVDYMHVHMKNQCKLRSCFVSQKDA